MNTALLREWLGLPPGPWPPGDRELLGLPSDGPVDAMAVEIKALERMDVLRPRQLVQPDLVTEGMNRLAQAMIALTANAPVAPIRKPKKVAKEATPVELRKADGDVRLDFDGPSARVTASPVPLPAVLDAEVIGFADEPAENVIPESVAVNTGEANLSALVEPIVIPDPPPGTAFVPSRRREGYRNLVAYRSFRNAWDRFRPLLGDPSEQLKTPAKIAAYLDAIAALRHTLRTHGTRLPLAHDAAGQMTVTVVCHPVPLSLLRDLVPSQRQALARDWAVARAEIDSRQRSLRRAMNASRRRRPIATGVRRVATMLIGNPEWILVLIAVAAIAIGFRRS